MYPVTLEMSRQEILVAHYLADVRIGEVTGGDKNVDKPMTPEERHAQDKAASLAEMALARYLNLYWTGISRAEIDVGGIHEVRSVREDHLNLILRPEDRNLRHYLVYVHEPFCTIKGWAFASEVRVSRYLKTPEGESYYWLMHREHLHTEQRERRA